MTWGVFGVIFFYPFEGNVEPLSWIRILCKFRPSISGNSRGNILCFQDFQKRSKFTVKNCLKPFSNPLGKLRILNFQIYEAHFCWLNFYTLKTIFYVHTTVFLSNLLFCLYQFSVETKKLGPIFIKSLPRMSLFLVKQKLEWIFLFTGTRA